MDQPTGQTNRRRARHAARMLAAALLVLGLGLTVAACGKKKYDSTLDKVLDTGELVIGTEPEFPPFESKDENGNYVGFDMDMARELAKDLGVKLRIEEMSWDSLPAALSTGKIDLIVSGMTITEERAESRAFTKPYFHTVLCLLVHKDSGSKRRRTPMASASR